MFEDGGFTQFTSDTRTQPLPPDPLHPRTLGPSSDPGPRVSGRTVSPTVVDVPPRPTLLFICGGYVYLVRVSTGRTNHK